MMTVTRTRTGRYPTPEMQAHHRTHHSAQSHPTDGYVIHWAWLYDSMVRLVALGRERELRRQTVERAELKPAQRVLDVGCGTGTLLIAALQAEPAIEARGIDPAVEMVLRARRKAAAAGVEADFDVGVIEQLASADDTFDVVLSSLMLHHLPAPTRAAGLAEIRRVLKPGGRLVAVDFAGAGPWFHRLGSLFTGGRSRPKGFGDQLMEQVQAAGFISAERRPLQPSHLFSLVARKPALAADPDPGRIR